MYYFIVILVFLILFSLATFIITFKKIWEQYNIKKKRIQLLSKNDSLEKDSTLSGSITELYIKCFSNYFTYCIGHFSAILLNTYSIILSVSSLSMISFTSLNGVDEITKSISLLSTFFIIALVFSRLDERSSYHLSAWRKCENAIINISYLISKYNDIDSIKDKIYSYIASCYTKTKSPNELDFNNLLKNTLSPDNNDDKHSE